MKRIKVSTHISRIDLYNDLWTIGITRTAKKLCVSNNRLKEACSANDIPIPSLSYWSNLSCGIFQEKTLLSNSLPEDAVVQLDHYELVDIPDAEKDQNKKSIPWNKICQREKEYLLTCETLSKYETLPKEYSRINWNGNIRLRNTYTHMAQRCYNKKDLNYYNYGGRGIRICSEWKNNPYSFIYWALTNGYNNKLTGANNSIDRIDNDRDYSPENCRWTTMKVQANNRRPRTIAA